MNEKLRIGRRNPCQELHAMSVCCMEILSQDQTDRQEPCPRFEVSSVGLWYQQLKLCRTSVSAAISARDERVLTIRSIQSYHFQQHLRDSARDKFNNDRDLWRPYQYQHLQLGLKLTCLFSASLFLSSIVANNVCASSLNSS